MNIKCLSSILLLIGSMGYGLAQNQIGISSYYMNGFGINPAYSSNGEDLFLSFRSSQFVGSESKRGLDYMSFAGYANLGTGLAAGARVSYQKLGDIGYTDSDLSVSYRVDFDQDQSLGFAVSTGIIREKMDLAGTSYSQYVNRNDPLLQGGDVFFDKTRVAIGAGAVYTYNSLQVGLYFPHLMYGENSVEGYFIANAKYVHDENGPSTVKIGSYAMFRNQSDGSNFYDAGLLVGMNDLVWINAGYRSTSEISSGVYMNMDGMQVGYNYNYNMSDFSDVISGRHEFTFILKSDKKSKQQRKNRWHKSR